MPSFVEYVEVSGADPLRQGDVLESVDPKASKWERNLFVLTADCDFAHDKHMGRVTCVPLLTKDEYLLEIQAPRLRDRYIEKPILELQKILAKRGAPNVTPTRLREWASEQDVDRILQSLELDESDLIPARDAFCAVRAIDSPVGTFAEFAQALVEAEMLSPGAPKRENAVKKITDRALQVFAQPPGDALFLGSLAAAHEEGYFAYLRHLEQVWHPDISIGASNKDAKYRRISRLQDRFTHALVQRFGMVFMSIGLPVEYENMRAFHAELIGEDVL